MIIGNKLDLVESRVIQTRVGRSLANEFGVRFAEVSAKTGEGMDEVSLHELQFVDMHY